MSGDATEMDTRRTAQGHRQAALDDARMAEFVFAAITDEARAFAEALTDLTIEHETAKWPRLRARSLVAHTTFRKSVAAFAADLINHHGNEAADGFMFRSVDKEAMGQTHVTVTYFEQLCKFWVEMGFLETTSFFRAKEAWDDGDELRAYLGRTRRYRPTPLLLKLGAQYGIETGNLKDHFEKQLGGLATVIVRGERPARYGQQAQPITIKKTGPRYDEEVQRILDVNGYLAVGGFDLEEAPRVNRIFNRGEVATFAYDQGGRLYCRSEDNWQSMSSKKRSTITCRGEPTVELDVHASHMFILYALHPKFDPPNGDHYLLANVDRDVVKGVATAILGRGGVPKQWPKALNQKYKEAGINLSKSYKLSTLVESLLRKHPVLGEVKKGVMDWAHLQYEESECFVEAILDLGRSHGITALPVHDSLIVAECNAKVAERALTGAYERRFGRSPAIRISTAGKQ